MEKTEITLEYTEQMAPLGRMLLPKKPPKKPFRGMYWFGK